MNTVYYFQIKICFRYCNCLQQGPPIPQPDPDPNTDPQVFGGNTLPTTYQWYYDPRGCSWNLVPYQLIFHQNAGTTCADLINNPI